MNLEKSMTRRGDRPNRQVGRLKMLLVTASVMATLAGARLLAGQEPVDTGISGETIMLAEPDANSSVIFLPQSSRGTKLELKPIPQVVQPRLNPIVRTQSSR